MNDFFRRVSMRAAEAIGSPYAFILAVVVLAIWGLTGPAFSYSDTWQLVINTATSLSTFLAVFLIQNMQNRDARAIHLKLDELIRSVEGARTGLVGLEEMPDDDIKTITDDFRRIHDQELDALEREVSSQKEALEDHVEEVVNGRPQRV